MVPSRLTPELRAQLDIIEPSQVRAGVLLRPCRVGLRDGNVLPRVYVADLATIELLCGRATPENHISDSWLSPDQVTFIRESPVRLPARFANKVYAIGESGMGYTSFIVKFGCWPGRRCAQGLADFIAYPPLQGPQTVRDVVPWLRPRWRNRVPPVPPRFQWCVFSD